VCHIHRRATYIGADTPVDDRAHAASQTLPDPAVLVAAAPERFDGLTAGLSRLAGIVPLALAGAGATQALANAVGARLLTADPVTEAQRMRVPPGSGLHLTPTITITMTMTMTMTMTEATMPAANLAGRRRPHRVPRAFGLTAVPVSYRLKSWRH
jgi:hypothetical protein